MTMLKLALTQGDKVIMGRNSHVSATNAAALIGFEPIWVYPRSEDNGRLPGRVHVDDIRESLEQNHDIKAVYITSPDYYGMICDVATISKLCREYGVPLLVDNAHGAHLTLLGGDHPIKLGAAMCTDSAHKTLPTLTGSAFLHIADERYTKDAKSVMSVFGSTSPSYLMMASMDLCVDYMMRKGRREYSRLGQRIYDLKKLARENGFAVPDGLCDPIRFTISAWDLGYTGQDLGDYLTEFKIIPEYIGGSYVVMVPTPNNTKRDFDRLESAILNIYDAAPIEDIPIKKLCKPEKIMTIRDAFLRKSEIVRVCDAVGMVAAESKSPCPPGIPIVVAGEVIDERLVEVLIEYGVLTIKVVK